MGEVTAFRCRGCGDWCDAEEAEDGYHVVAVCCGRPGSECCGLPDPQPCGPVEPWEEEAPDHA